MPDTGVTAQVADRVLYVELGEPGEMNLLSIGTRKRILEILMAHEHDAGVSCVVISSRGKVFSAGADLKEIMKLGKGEAKSYSKFVRSFLDYVEGYPKPTIALVDGIAVGGALELLMTLDIVFATPESSFGQTELNVGLIPGGGGSQRLPRLVGARAAKEMIFTGRLVPASEALELGLVTKVVPADRIPEESADMIEKLKTKSPEKLSLVKRAMNEGLSSSLPKGLDLETKLYSEAVASERTKQEIADFLEKRKARS